LYFEGIIFSTRLLYIKQPRFYFKYYMKRLSYIFIVLVIASLPLLGEAQSRIAFVDGTKLLKKMPETADVESRLQQLIDTWNREANDMQTELERKKSELKKRLDAYRQGKYGTSGELFTQQATLMKPIYDKFLKAVSEVATEEKFDYVFDRGDKSHSMLFGNAKFDLSNAIAKKLGLETNDVFSTPLLDRFNNNSTNTNSGVPPQPPVDRRPPQDKEPPVIIEK
jgi:outer membrane protein